MNFYPNFRASLDLSKIFGAKILNITQDGKTEPCVVIPCRHNDMIRTDKEGNRKITPYLDLNLWRCNDKFVSACAARHANEPDYVAPTHHVEVSFSKDFRERAMAIAEKRILEEKPDISPDDLKNAVRDAVRFTLGTIAPMRSDGKRGYQPQGVAQGAPADVQSDLQQVNTDDLPF